MDLLVRGFAMEVFVDRHRRRGQVEASCGPHAQGCGGHISDEMADCKCGIATASIFAADSSGKPV